MKHLAPGYTASDCWRQEVDPGGKALESLWLSALSSGSLNLWHCATDRRGRGEEFFVTLRLSLSLIIGRRDTLGEQEDSY